MMALLLLCLVSIILFPLVLTLAEEAVLRWRYRHLPGPPQRLLTGNLTDVIRGGLLLTVDRWIQQYGSIYQLRLMGRLLVVVSDPDAVRTLMYKITNHAPIQNANFSLMAGKLRAIDQYGLVTAKDDFWRTARTAWMPAFAPASLRGYQSLMDRDALALVKRLEARIGGGGGGEGRQQNTQQKQGAEGEGADATNSGDVVEMRGELSRTTLAVVGTAAYGVDFTAPEYGGSGMAVAGASAAALSPSGNGELSLVQACSDWFRTMGPSYISRWAVATAFPRFLPPLRHLACAFPDAALAAHLRACRVIIRTAQRLIDAWRQAHETPAAGAPAAAAAVSRGMAADSDRKPNGSVAATDGGASRAAGVAPGSFLGLMLAARDKAHGRGLSDIELSAQVQTFMLAGFETTANALTFAVYHLARHPDKAEALRRELDSCLPPLPRDGEEEAPLTGEVLDKLVYTEAVIQEAMRLHPPVHTTSRITDRPIKVLGYDIPAGTSFLIPINHLHNADQLWPDAQAFRPERFLASAGSGGKGATIGGETGFGGGGGGSDGGDTPLGPRHPHAYQPFGAGSRMCVGWRFAMQEAKTVLARLFQRLDFTLVPGQVPLEVVSGLTLAPKHGVLVRLARRGE